MIENEMVAVGAVPIHPGVLDYADANGKIILYVKDEEEGRSLFMSIEMYGELTRAYEVRWDDWANTVSKMLAKVELADSTDPLAELFNMEETND
jgi:hypothetical protein